MRNNLYWRRIREHTGTGTPEKPASVPVYLADFGISGDTHRNTVEKLRGHTMRRWVTMECMRITVMPVYLQRKRVVWQGEKRAALEAGALCVVS